MRKNVVNIEGALSPVPHSGIELNSHAITLPIGSIAEHSDGTRSIYFAAKSSNFEALTLSTDGLLKRQYLSRSEVANSLSTAVQIAPCSEESTLFSFPLQELYPSQKKKLELKWSSLPPGTVLEYPNGVREELIRARDSLTTRGEARVDSIICGTGASDTGASDTVRLSIRRKVLNAELEGDVAPRIFLPVSTATALSEKRDVAAREISIDSAKVTNFLENLQKVLVPLIIRLSGGAGSRVVGSAELNQMTTSLSEIDCCILTGDAAMVQVSEDRKIQGEERLSLQMLGAQVAAQSPNSYVVGIGPAGNWTGIVEVEGEPRTLIDAETFRTSDGTVAQNPFLTLKRNDLPSSIEISYSPLDPSELRDNWKWQLEYKGAMALIDEARTSLSIPSLHIFDGGGSTIRQEIQACLSHDPPLPMILVNSGGASAAFVAALKRGEISEAQSKQIWVVDTWAEIRSILRNQFGVFKQEAHTPKDDGEIVQPTIPRLIENPMQEAITKTLQLLEDTIVDSLIEYDARASQTSENPLRRTPKLNKALETLEAMHDHISALSHAAAMLGRFAQHDARPVALPTEQFVDAQRGPTYYAALLQKLVAQYEELASENETSPESQDASTLLLRSRFDELREKLVNGVLPFIKELEDAMDNIPSGTVEAVLRQNQPAIRSVRRTKITEPLASVLADMTNHYLVDASTGVVPDRGIALSRHTPQYFLNAKEQGARLLTYRQEQELMGYALYFDPISFSRRSPLIYEGFKDYGNTAFVYFLLTAKGSDAEGFHLLLDAIKFDLARSKTDVILGWVHPVNKQSLSANLFAAKADVGAHVLQVMVDSTSEQGVSHPTQLVSVLHTLSKQARTLFPSTLPSRGSRMELLELIHTQELTSLTLPLPRIIKAGEDHSTNVIRRRSAFK